MGSAPIAAAAARAVRRPPNRAHTTPEGQGRGRGDRVTVAFMTRIVVATGRGVKPGALGAIGLRIRRYGLCGAAAGERRAAKPKASMANSETANPASSTAS